MNCKNKKGHYLIPKINPVHSAIIILCCQHVSCLWQLDHVTFKDCLQITLFLWKHDIPEQIEQCVWQQPSCNLWSLHTVQIAVKLHTKSLWPTSKNVAWHYCSANTRDNKFSKQNSINISHKGSRSSLKNTKIHRLIFFLHKQNWSFHCACPFL